MPADFANTVVPTIVVVAFILLMWYKLREPLSRFWEWFAGMMSSGKEKSVETVKISKEIIYDI